MGTNENTHIVCSIAVVVDATKKGRCGVSANVLGKEMATTRMLVQEVRNIVDEAPNADQWTRLGLLLVCSPYVHQVMVRLS